MIGNQSASEGLAAQLDMDKLISRHCAILGATGSGKSNAVSIVVKAIAEKPFPSARVLMIDPHWRICEFVDWEMPCVQSRGECGRC